MSINKWMEHALKKMHWYDISMVKLCVFFFTLFMLTAWTGFRELVLGISWYWYLIIAVILMIPLLMKMFSD